MSKDKDYQQVAIEQEMKKSYLDYAMSVIVGRALPDVRDGLKPVHRRVLYAMHQLGNSWNKAYKKSARIVGDVIGKYHPHGDAAVYDTIVRLAQDFSMRYQMVNGQGNFGSVDGDPPAAMRYTEIRLQKIAHEMLLDINKDTVDFGPNYDDTLTEPLVLPNRVPNLLINGIGGIAVGMATSIPPHNLTEVIDATFHLMENPDAGLDDLMQFVKGPDFPTSGIIYGMRGILNGYRTGRGIIKVRGKSDVEEFGKRERIVITELPYQVNKARLLEKIADLVKDKRIEGISDLRDESDRKGMRVVIELKKDAMPQIIINSLIKHTAFQSSFSINFLAIVNGRPQLSSLKQLLEHFINHRREVITRRSLFDLKKAKAEIHILQGLLRALDLIDEVIKIIRGSRTVQEANDNLITQLEFSKEQSTAILRMPLSKLTGLEKEKLIDDIKKLEKIIAELEAILGSTKRLLKVIKKELSEIREEYGDERRTKIEHEIDEIGIEDLIPDEEVVVTVTHAGYVKRTPLNLYRSQKRGGRGVTGQETKEDDFVQNVFQTSNHARLLIFTNNGKAYYIKVYQIPQLGRAAKGRPIVNMIKLGEDEKVLQILTVKGDHEEETLSVVMATAMGKVKRTNLFDYRNAGTKGIIALNCVEGDQVVGVALSDGKRQLVLSTSMGMACRFIGEEIRSMGRGAMGVRGMRLAPGDKVVSLAVVSEEEQILSIASNGMGKKSLVENYRLTHRGSKGVISMKLSNKKARIVGTITANDDEDVMLVTNHGIMIRFSMEEVRKIHRSGQGVRLIRLKDDEQIVGFATVPKEEDEDEFEGEGQGENAPETAETENTSAPSEETSPKEENSDEGEESSE